MPVTKDATTARKRVGIVGCGALTRSNYAQSLPYVSEVRVACVHDLDSRAAALAARQFEAAAVSLDALCQQVDTVIVATPPATHYGIVKTCLERGRNVVCEKPFVGRYMRHGSWSRLPLGVVSHCMLDISDGLSPPSAWRATWS